MPRSDGGLCPVQAIWPVADLATIREPASPMILGLPIDLKITESRGHGVQDTASVLFGVEGLQVIDAEPGTGWPLRGALNAGWVAGLLCADDEQLAPGGWTRRLVSRRGSG